MAGSIPAEGTAAVTVIASALTPTFPTLGGLNRSTRVRMGVRR